MPARPRRRRSVAGAVLLGLTVLAPVGLAGAGTAAAADRDSLRPAPASLRAAVASGEAGYAGLPRGIVRRGTGDGRLTTSAAPEAGTPAGTTSDGTGPGARGSLTTSPVSAINVTYRSDGAVWSTAAKEAFEAAVKVWERTLESAVPIEIEATATTFSDPTVLGGAGPYDFRRNDQRTASLLDDVFEPVALASARTGRDVLPGEPDIVAEFDPGLSNLYFGTDGNPPPGKYDFRTVVLHEIGHGLGLVGTASVDEAGVATVGDRKVNGTSGVRSGVSYDVFTYASTPDRAGDGGQRILAMDDGSAELRSALTGESLYWSGQLARTASGGARIPLYAPQVFYEGSSYGHLDEGRYPGEDSDGLMTPYLKPGEAFADVGQIAMGMLADMGYPMPALRGARYTALEPVRLLDTRIGLGAEQTPVKVGGLVDLRVTGSPGVPSDATAVVLNVTAVNPSAATDIRVYPTPVVPAPVPVVSNLNLERGATRANLVTVPVGNNGRVRLRNNSGGVQLLADLAGYYSPAAEATFTPADPVRILDTRSAVGTPRTIPLGPGESLDLAVSGAGSPVPADAAAVALTVTGVGASTSTDVRVYPTPTDGIPAPKVSSINLDRGGVVPNVVVVKVGPDGTVRLRNTAGTVHLLADVAGWYDGSLSGTLFRPVSPSRLLDTRVRLGTSPDAPTTVGAGESIVLRVGGSAQVPSLARAAVLNVTGVAATTSTDVRVYPATSPEPPRVSNLNLARGQTAADLVVAKLAERSVRLRNSTGQVALVADVAGWFGPATP